MSYTTRFSVYSFSCYCVLVIIRAEFWLLLSVKICLLLGIGYDVKELLNFIFLFGIVGRIRGGLLLVNDMEGLANVITCEDVKKVNNRVKRALLLIRFFLAILRVFFFAFLI